MRVPSDGDISTSARECSRERSLSWTVMVVCAGSRSGPRAYAALMPQSKSGIWWRNSPQERDRGVGGSNPLAPTTVLSKSSKGLVIPSVVFGRSDWELWG